MTFQEWYKAHPLWDVRLPVVETWLSVCWHDAIKAERERCKKIAKHVGDYGISYKLRTPQDVGDEIVDRINREDA